MEVVQINNIRIIPETDFEQTFNLTDADGSTTSLIGVAVTSAEISKWPNSENKFYFDTIFDTNTGVLKLQLDKTYTSKLEFGRNYYRINFIKDGKVFRSIEGTAIVQK